MNLRGLIPWGRNNNQAPSVYRDPAGNPLLALHRGVNWLFDDAFRSFVEPVPTFGNLSPWGAAWPTVEISETDTELRVTADLPGLEEKDIEVLLEDGALTLRGEQRAETEDKARQFSERFYGRFERRIPLGIEIEEDKVTAGFNNGVLTVTLPKTARTRAKGRHIAIDGKH